MSSRGAGLQRRMALLAAEADGQRQRLIAQGTAAADDVRKLRRSLRAIVQTQRILRFMSRFMSCRVRP